MLEKEKKVTQVIHLPFKQKKKKTRYTFDNATVNKPSLYHQDYFFPHSQVYFKVRKSLSLEWRARFNKKIGQLTT